MADAVMATETTPATPSAGNVTVYPDSADLRMKAKDANGVVTTLANVGPQDENLLINGGFAVQQRVAVAATNIPNVSATTRAGQVADRWAVTVGNVTTPQWAQIDTAAAIETGLLSRYYGKIIQNTNAAKFILSQFVLNSHMAHLRGQKVRLSVKIKQFVGANANYRLGLIYLNASGTVDVSPAFISAIGAANVEPTWGTNLVAIAPDAAPVGENGTIAGVALTIASTAAWVRSSAVFTIPTTALNLIPVLYRDTLGAASDALGIAEFQMTQGPDIVDYSEPDFGTQLIECQRFFCKSFPQTTVPAASLTVAAAGAGEAGIIGKAGATALAVHIPVRFPAVMWKTPTVTLFTPVNSGAVPMRIDGTTPASQTAVAQLGLTDRGLIVTATGDAAGAVGDLVGVHYVADAELVA